jgi:hypothetical protein
MSTDEIQYIRQRLDDVSDTLSRHTVILEANTESLREHMRRTDLLEKQVDVALIPIRVSRAALVVLGVLGSIAGAAVGIWEYIHR